MIEGRTPGSTARLSEPRIAQARSPPWTPPHPASANQVGQCRHAYFGRQSGTAALSESATSPDHGLPQNCAGTRGHQSRLPRTAVACSLEKSKLSESAPPAEREPPKSLRHRGDNRASVPRAKRRTAHHTGTTSWQAAP